MTIEGRKRDISQKINGNSQNNLALAAMQRADMKETSAQVAELV